MQILRGGGGPGTDRVVDERYRRYVALLFPAENAPARSQPYGVVVGKQLVLDAQTVHVLPRSDGKNVVPNRDSVLAADLDGRARRPPEHVVLDDREHGVGGPIPIGHADGGRHAVGHAIGNAQLRTAVQIERDVAQPDRHPFGRSPKAVVERHRVAKGIGDRKVPQADADGVIDLNAAGLEIALQDRPAHQRVRAALEHDRIGGQRPGGVGLGNPPRHARRVGARVDIDDIPAFQIVLGQQIVEVRLGRIRRNA